MEELFFVALQEDVVFPEGEEVDELLSISLDPQVVIQGASVQGSIEVTGEYRINDHFGMEEDSVRQFFRHIPVQAILPPDQRAADGADIEIHTFDYTVKKPDRLILEAELAIAVSAVRKVEEEQEPIVAAAYEYETEASFENDLEELEDSETEESIQAEEDQEADQTAETEDAAVQVQKRAEDDASIFSWLEERPVQQTKWRFQVSSGNVELIATQDEEQPPGESKETAE
ncbi:hypothetical protein [Domibacillus robiginosus]|uniref:hypothetical protein n=1 Tax=Domibacillus robiginosus TaxID=1071054 RepID=UPI00067E3FF0|nr:hypothetical protein [Domibacillus robiginosus]